MLLTSVKSVLLLLDAMSLFGAKGLLKRPWGESLSFPGENMAPMVEGGLSLNDSVRLVITGKAGT